MLWTNKYSTYSLSCVAAYQEVLRKVSLVIGTCPPQTFTSPPEDERNIAINLCVCLSAGISQKPHIPASGNFRYVIAVVTVQRCGFGVPRVWILAQGRSGSPNFLNPEVGVLKKKRTAFGLLFFNAVLPYNFCATGRDRFFWATR